MSLALEIMVWLILKHFIVDFPLQTKYQWSNKGTYSHPGGVLHSGLHGIGTGLVLIAWTPWAWWIGLLDAVIHYHVDWGKMNLNARFRWGPTTHEQFWWLLGFDQFLHMLTYIGLVYLTSLTT